MNDLYVLIGVKRPPYNGDIYEILATSWDENYLRENCFSIGAKLGDQNSICPYHEYHILKLEDIGEGVFEKPLEI